MLKSSGTMRHIKDKQLLKSIMECYHIMENAQNVNAKEMDIKAQEFYNSAIKNGMQNAFDIRRPEYRELFNYLSIHSQIESEFQACAEQIEQTLMLF